MLTQVETKNSKRRVLRGDLPGLDALEVEALGAFVWADVRPLSGAVGYLDWRLCGALSRALERRVFNGERGEAMLLPHNGRLDVRRLFVFGLGRVSELEPAALKTAVRAAYEVMRRAGVTRVVLSAGAQARHPEVEAAFVKAAYEELGASLEAILACDLE